MGRKILFITTDQQRYDTIGCNGATFARTPNIDSLAETGIRYERMHNQSVVCMPSRSTMLTGQHQHTHGVWMNGIPLPEDAPSVAADLHTAGYKTALVGKAHFEPFFDPFSRFTENKLSGEGVFTLPSRQADGTIGVHRGFDHMELATHGAVGALHYALDMNVHHPEMVGDFYRVLDNDFEVNAESFGETGAPQVKYNEVPRDLYHTDWVANKTIDWLNTLGQGDDFFCWMSFPDPHHPWDPPTSEKDRVPWRDIDLPDGYIEDRSERERVIDGKPRHWRLWYDGNLVGNYEAPKKWVPSTMTPDQVREVNALNAVEVELIDEAIGRVLATIEARGWTDDVDVIFTTDHGELQGDYGLLFKGPYHTDALMRLPLIWKPAPSASIPSQVVTKPVSMVDLAPTFATIAGLQVPGHMQGNPLPTDDRDAATRGFERSLTAWDCELFGVCMYLRTIHRDGYTATYYLPGTVHDGTEGELYVHAEDPLQRTNRWDDPALRGIRNDLIADLRDHQPPVHDPELPVAAPV